MSTISSTKTIVVFGATGLQGSEMILALSKHNTPEHILWNILALTRNISSSSSQRLAKLPGVKVIQAGKRCMDEPEQVFASLGLAKGDVYGVFSVQSYVDDKTMVAQGNAIAHASHAFGVKHIVYSSVDLGGMADTGISAFEVKRQVENTIRALPGMGYTLLQPVHFMENWVPDLPFFLKIGRTIVMKYTFYKNPDRKHQLVSCKSIGQAGAKAFVEGPQWCDGAIRLAGDELTAKEINQLHQEVLGIPVQLAIGAIARTSKAVVPHLSQMSRFYDEHGFNVDIQAVRNELPELEDFRTFLLRYKSRRA